MENADKEGGKCDIPMVAFAPRACTAAMVCTMTPLGNSDHVGGFPSTVMMCRRRGTKETMSWRDTNTLHAPPPSNSPDDKDNSSHSVPY
jgi:hypothetical protein